MEYKTLTAPTLISVAQLEELAQEGWRLIQIINWNNAFYFYFSREKAS